MAIQENDIYLFGKLLIPAISWFLVFNCKNFANGFEVFLLQWNSWTLQNHPAAAWLPTNFKACSEEYGESAIHNLMTHIREWDYSGYNLKKDGFRVTERQRCLTYFEFQGLIGPVEQNGFLTRNPATFYLSSAMFFRMQ